MKRPLLLPPLLLLLLPCLLLVEARGQFNPEGRATFAKWLTPEQCAGSYPHELYGEYLDAGNTKWDSEGTRMAFLDDYAVVLAKRTDEKFPEVMKIRKPVQATFRTTLEFIRHANGGMGGHMGAWLEAEVEWEISQGFEAKFALGKSGKYTHGDLRELGRIFQRTRAKLVVGSAMDPLTPDAFEAVLEKLKIAEQSMSKEAAMYFRARLVAMIAGYMGRE